SHAGTPSDYIATLNEIKDRIRSERVRVAMAANAAMVLMYWEIGRVILARQADEGWGARVIDRLSADLRNEFPDMQGLSPRNLLFMRAFAENYPDAAIVKQLVSSLPWGHVVHLIQRIKDPEARNWYARAAVADGWSRSILDLQIESQAHLRQGKAVNNFALTLPPADSDLVAQIFKDPYLFDFIGTADPRREREVEQALVDHVQKFLLELGAGFAFVGRQVHLEFASKDYYLDLLFYHLKLRCYVVVELKAVPFEPEFVGKLNMYMSAVDDLLRHPADQPTIGLLLCAGKDRIIAEYALNGCKRPIGVADWTKQLTETLPADLKGSLPTVAEIEAELSAAVEQTAARSRQGQSDGEAREAPAAYGTDRVRIVDAPFATSGAETPFGCRRDGGTIPLSPEHLAALAAGKTLALDVRDEYVAILKADGAHRKRAKGQG
ncbi:MAG: PDDEXK nuclease domain-containing protein, partial [Lentisphaeria bacterium]|nr:PDDEXK nuclease domain-containing protein [Lentisphaeria bacterium]